MTVPGCQHFPSREAAQDHQLAHGGWIFLPHQQSYALWYPAEATVYAIFCHPETGYLNGHLLSDPADPTKVSLRPALEAA